MAMKRKNRDYWFDSNGGNSRGSFEEHDEQMSGFRNSHADVAMVNGPRLDEATLLERMLYLRVNYVVETGGSALPIDTTDRSALVPVLKVGRYKLSQN